MPKKNSEEVKISSPILVKFTGPVKIAEMAKVAITDELGNEAAGEWTSLYGDTEWTFKPNTTLKSNTKYTVRIPETLVGDNGMKMGSDYTYHFKTASESTVTLECISPENGAYRLTGKPADADKYTLRFTVSNDAHNLAEIYTPEDSTSPIAAIGISGKGVYECDVTEYVRGRSELTFLIKSANAEGIKGVYTSPIEAQNMITLGNVSAEYTDEIAGTDGACALKVTDFGHTTISGSKESVTYYANSTNVLKCTGIIKDGALNMSDMGRTFTISFRVYDTTSRRLQVYLNSNTSAKFHTADYNATRYNLTTKPGEWLEFSFNYTVYEPKHGEVGNVYKTLYIDAETFGDISTKFPLYIDSIKSYETVTTVNVTDAQLIYGK